MFYHDCAPRADSDEAVVPLTRVGSRRGGVRAAPERLSLPSPLPHPAGLRAMQTLVSPVTKAIFIALFLFAILLILYVILWYICRDVDNEYI